MTLATSRALVMLVLPVAVLVVTAVVSKVLSARPASHRRSTDRLQPALLISQPVAVAAMRCCTVLHCNMNCSKTIGAHAEGQPGLLHARQSCGAVAPVRARACMRRSAHERARKHSHLHTHIARTYTNTHTHTRAVVHTRTRTRAHASPQTPMRAPTHVCARAGTRAS